MVDLSEIVAIWRGETKRALKSGRVLVLLILFLLFVALALTVVGGAMHQLNAKFEQQAAMAGADLSAAQSQLSEQKKQFLKMFVTEDEAMLEALASIPIVLLVVFKLTLRFLPLFIALMGFDQLAGEVGPKSIRYLIVRVKRSSIILGKLLSQITIFAMLLSICTLLMVIVARVLNPDFAAAQVALWTVKLITSSLVLSLAYLALTALFSAITRQSGIALVLNVIALFVIWFIALIAEIFRFPGEEAAMNSLAMLKSESWLAYLRYGSVWHFGDDLLHPSWARALPAALVHVGYGLVFLGLAQFALKKRDL
ncbi:MAG: ABC transporter permease [Archangium gephyra]|uniref:ABC transporter permease n=1 Tax=Archangium gephyra TaxID=48 RepID=A0A2W5VLH9_9BACT|nr:MAG: ABC transporter permease [Archangium gephyra]